MIQYDSLLSIPSLLSFFLISHRLNNLLLFIFDTFDEIYTPFLIFFSAVSPVMYFNGTQNMLVKMPPNTKHQVEDVVIRFRTIRPVGLLFATTHKAGDTVEIGVFGGKIRLMVKINNREKVTSSQLNKWPL